MIPKEFQKWNLALELKAGKNRLEGVLHGLSDEQSERAGVTRSGSVVDVLSEIVATEFLALMAISSRLPGLPVNRLANADEGTRAARGTGRRKQVLRNPFGRVRHAALGGHTPRRGTQVARCEL